jgi:molecular chaperone GrpE
MKNNHVNAPQPPETAGTDSTATAPEAAASAEVAAPETSAAELEELKKQAALATEHWNSFLRATADFDNFKKRVARERQDLLKYGADGLMQKLIPVLDNFEAALAAASNAEGDAAKSLQTGVAMIHQQLRTALADSGLKEIEAAGRPFDPNFHEAVAQEASDSLPEGHVVRQLRRGYQLHDRLLRPASVIVTKKSEPAA